MDVAVDPLLDDWKTAELAFSVTEVEEHCSCRCMNCKRAVEEDAEVGFEVDSLLCFRRGLTLCECEYAQFLGSRDMRLYS